MTVHLVDFNRVQIYEAGAMLVTLLAYPGASGSSQPTSRVPLRLYAPSEL